MNAALDLRFAGARDLPTAQRFDAWLPTATLERKLAAGEILLAERDGVALGYLRLDYLWSSIPFIAMIQVVAAHRRQGVGRALLRALEAALRAQDHTLLLSSSQADEPEPQAWHRHMGFEECGIISGINPGGIGEIFFRKRL